MSRLAEIYPFLTEAALLGLRLLTAAVFITSGRSHAKDLAAGSKDLGLPKVTVALVGWVEILAGLGVAFGLLTRLSAIGLMVIMVGAMYKKIAVWHTGFWGEKASGWHYDLLFFLIALLFLATAGGSWTLDRIVLRSVPGAGSFL
ncbi:MAG TPA: DoxX family protein [Thermoanaerobaculia bacterium]|jgi:putative oxidoreductase|nr:DoxX family protein [Thermoanaerobaculia bacterium]